MARISCIIPTRNRCAMVVEAVASAYGQDEKVFEVIVVDDGSTDGTEAELGKLYPDITIIPTTGIGPGPARNAGVEVSSGEFLMFLDSDDLWMPDHVAKLSEVLCSGYKVAYGTTRNVDMVNGGEFFIPEKDENIEGDCYHQLLRWCFLVPSSFAVERNAFLASGGFVLNSMGEDWDFFLRLAEQHHFGFAGREPITLRRLHRGSLCSFVDKGMLLDSVSSIRNALAKLSNNNHHADIRFRAMERFIMENGETWSTVQDWYTAMKNEGFI